MFETAKLDDIDPRVGSPAFSSALPKYVDASPVSWVMSLVFGKSGKARSSYKFTKLRKGSYFLGHIEPHGSMYQTPILDKRRREGAGVRWRLAGWRGVGGEGFPNHFDCDSRVVAKRTGKNPLMSIDMTALFCC